jgi:uncharacterized integral membrane protein
MKRISNVLAWSVAVLVAVFAAINWSTLMADAPLNLLVMQVQAPLGVVLLALAAVLSGLFALASLRSQIGSLLESRRLLKEIQRAHDLADKAEASRVESLQRLITGEFQRLNDRLTAAEAARAASVPESPVRPFVPAEVVAGRVRA